MEEEGWIVVFTDGSAKQVGGGGGQAGFGVFFEVLSSRNFSARVPPHERQSVRRAELRGVLQALKLRWSGEHMVIVLDPEYVYKGIIEWSPKRRRHGWRTTSGEVGHRDLWEGILQLREQGGRTCTVGMAPVPRARSGK